MGTFLLRRLLQSLIVIVGVTAITFVALQIGGDPTYLYVSERASEAEIQQTRAALGFDRPLPEQYLSFVGASCRATSAPRSPSSDRRSSRCWKPCPPRSS
jgi:ABC-type dipeptide/oligopeptide/nickel transport system permease component